MYIYKRQDKKEESTEEPDEKERDIRVKCFGQIKMVNILGVWEYYT
jgi:hypothetical protein